MQWLIDRWQPGMGEHTYNPSTQEVKAGGPPPVGSQPGLNSETLS